MGTSCAYMYATIYYSYHKETHIINLPNVRFYQRLIDDCYIFRFWNFGMTGSLFTGYHIPSLSYINYFYLRNLPNIFLYETILHICVGTNSVEITEARTNAIYQHPLLVKSIPDIEPILALPFLGPFFEGI